MVQALVHSLCLEVQEKMTSGISLVISKPCCPMYNFDNISNIKCCTSNKIKFCTSNKINFFTSNKTDLIPCRLSNLPHRGISLSVAIKPMVKHRVYPLHSGEVEMVSRFGAPEVSSTIVPYCLLGLLGIIGLTLPKAWEVVPQFITAMMGKEGLLKSSASYFFPLGVVAVLAFKGFLGNIICGFLVLHHKPFSTGDIIEVGYLKSQVIEMGLLTTSLLSVENQTIVVPTSGFHGQVIVNKSRGTTYVPYTFLSDQEIAKKPLVAPYHAMISKIYLDEVNNEEVSEIMKEITEMMISNSNVYLEKRKPSCRIAIFRTYYEITLVCHLKQASEDELYSVKQDILLLSAQIIKKHGARLGGHKGEVKC